MGALRALLWDVDGTIAETEREGHRVAFNRAFEAFGLSWRWDDAHYARLLRVTGGRERLLHDMTRRADAPPVASEREALARALHQRKNVEYEALVRRGGIALRGGVRELMDECLGRGVRMGIATTTSRSNLDALLGVQLGTGWAERFAVTVCGEGVQRKKPDPEVYLAALRELRLGPLDVVALEDSPGGVASARAADCAVVVTRSAYFVDAPIEGAIAIGPGLDTREGWHPAPALGSHPGRVHLDDIGHWHALRDTVSAFP